MEAAGRELLVWDQATEDAAASLDTAEIATSSVRISLDVSPSTATVMRGHEWVVRLDRG